MEKFITLKGIAAPLPMINVDTDMIIPKQFLKTIKRSGLGKNLFHELRFDMQGNIKNDFVLNWKQKDTVSYCRREEVKLELSNDYNFTWSELGNELNKRISNSLLFEIDHSTEWIISAVRCGNNYNLDTVKIT